MNIMNNKKFQHLINTALKYNSTLYAVPNTDLFAIFKNGKMIYSYSTGIASAPSGYSELLKEVFSGEGFMYKGVAENIDFVKETSAKVSVKFSRYEAYTIYKNQDGWITLSW